MKNLICWLSLICLALAPVPSALAEAAGAHAIEARTVNLYYDSPEDCEPLTLYFMDGADVPYLPLSAWGAIARRVILGAAQSASKDAENSFTFAFSMDGNTGVLTREDGYTAAFDCDADTIRFLDYDAFLRLSSEYLLTEMVYAAEPDADGAPVRYFRPSEKSYQRYGSEVVINAADYGIDFIAQGGECYVPMQTLCDLMLCNFYTDFFWNGEIAIICSPNSLGRSSAPTPLAELYYSVPPRARSAAMARFAYAELCMVLDTSYGLKDNHSIDRFDDLVDDLGLKPALTGTDPVEADAALYTLLELHLDDQHTAFRLPSPLSGLHAADSFSDDLGSGQSGQGFDAMDDLYNKARSAAYPDGVPVYEEFGNTAFITLDGFNQVPDGVDYYEAPPTEDATDTLGIMIYAYSRITRPDSPIENVVLDLSCNGGGMADAAIFTMAAFLGVGTLSTRNTLSGALVTGSYTIDINLDGKADAGDLGLTGKNLFCLESPLCFSCGNLVTCAFKASSRVTLLGRASGGGACFVQALSTADGACCNMSSAVQMSFIKNGAFYDNDRGAEPDFILVKPESFYDRPALTAFINGLM